MNKTKSVLARLMVASLAILPVDAQENLQSYKLFIETLGVGRCLFMEGHLTQDQSSSFIVQYLNKKGFTGTQVRNLSKMKDLEEQVEGFIKASGGCKSLSTEVIKRTP